MKVTKFWIVTKPTPVSELVDICFKCDLARLQGQFAAGLKADNIHGMYTKQKEAEDIARWLLHLRDDGETE